MTEDCIREVQRLHADWLETIRIHADIAEREGIKPDERDAGIKVLRICTEKVGFALELIGAPCPEMVIDPAIVIQGGQQSS